MSTDRIPQEYLNNENPFAYLRNYLDNPFLDPSNRPRLDALQQIQPKFIPLGIDANTLRTEQQLKTRAAIESRTMDLLTRGMELVNSDVPDESVLRDNIDVPGVLDILIDINRLRLLHSQRRLREKVFCTLKSTLPSDIVNASDSAVDEDRLADALEYERLSRPRSE